MCELQEISVTMSSEPWPDRVQKFVEEGLRRSKSINCFDFVPSNYRVVYQFLAAIPRGRFCEWGSGMGIVTGLAEMLGFGAAGIERDPTLAAAARDLLKDFGLSASIEAGDYFEHPGDADVYFTYCWPGQMARTERHFYEAAPAAARLLICHGADDIRCKVKPNEVS